MITDEIKKYVADQRTAGFSENEIKGALAASGWSEADITTLLKPNTVPISPEPKAPDTPLPRFSTVAQSSDEPASTTPIPATAQTIVPTIEQQPQHHFLKWLLIVFSVLMALFILVVAFVLIVVPVSLNSARSKGADASIRSNLDNNRAEAEIAYDTATPNSYAGVCDDPMIQKVLAQVQQVSGQTPICKATPISYIMAGKLSTGKMYCVDSSGVSTTTPSVSQTQVLCDPNATPTSDTTAASSTTTVTMPTMQSSSTNPILGTTTLATSTSVSNDRAATTSQP